MRAIDDEWPNEDEHITFNQDEFILVFRDSDKENGVTNVGHVFRESDLHDELNNVNHESPYGFQWAVLDTDYDNVLMLSACFEKVQRTNAKGEEESEVQMMIDHHRELRQKAHMMPEDIQTLRKLQADNAKFSELLEKMKTTSLTPREETDALHEAIDGADNDSEGIINGSIDLRDENDILPWENLRKLLFMPLDELDQLVQDRKKEEDRVAKEISEDDYKDRFDQKFVKEEA